MVTYCDKEPSGARAMAFYFAQLMKILVDINGDGSKEFKLKDFVPWTDHTIPDELLTEDEYKTKYSSSNDATVELIKQQLRQVKEQTQ